MKELILAKDYTGIKNAFLINPELVQEGWAYDEKNIRTAHPLHRICDLVFSGQLTDEEAASIGEIYLAFGSNVNGYEMVIKKDTPLLAAASLHADKVALLYISHRANIHHQGCHGGTALHWAAWCGRDIVVKKLIEEGADINKRCIDFQATPLFWAVMSYNEKNDPYHQLECVRLLLEAGADRNIPNSGGTTIYTMLKDSDMEMRKIFTT